MACKLSDDQIKAIIEGLKAGLTHREIASNVGAAKPTVTKYANLPEVRAEVGKFKQQVLAEKIDAFSEVTDKEIEEIRKWADDAIAHIDDIMKASKMARSGGMGTMSKALKVIRNIPEVDVRLGDAVAMLKAGHDLLMSSFEMEARAIGIYELVEQAHERNKQSEG